MYAIEWAADETSALPTLRRGMINPSVKILQLLLTEAGHPLDPDGNFGERTEQAVKDFQQEVDLTQDGVVTADTWEALRDVTSRLRTPSREPSGAGGQSPMSKWVGIGIIGAALLVGVLTLWPQSTPRRTR